DVDFTLEAAHDIDRADPVDRFERLLDQAARDLGELLHAQVTGHGQGHHRHRVEVELLYQRRLGAFGELIEHGGDLVAHVLHGAVEVALELELDYHARNAFERLGAQLVDRADGVDRLFERLGDPCLHLLGGGAGQHRGNHHGRDVDLGEQVDSQPAVGKGSEHDQYADEHRGEHRPA